MSTKIQTVINFINLQIAWFACVLGAANAMPWVGISVTLMVLAWHLYTCHFLVEELKLIIIILFIGGIFDQYMVTSKLIEYHHHGWGTLNTFVPTWILALWAGFATSLNVCLRWMRKRILIAMLFGFFGGPMAYLGAEKLGAIVLKGSETLLILAVGWAVIMPLIIKLSERFDGFKHA